MIASTAIENAIPAAPNNMLDQSQQGAIEELAWALTADADRISLW